MDPPEPDSPPGPKPTPNVGDFFWVGTACVIAIVGAGGAGYGLDSALNTLPWLTFLGLAFGVVSAVLIVVSQMRKYL
jgi:hypothetical protein